MKPALTLRRLDLPGSPPGSAGKPATDQALRENPTPLPSETISHRRSLIQPSKPPDHDSRETTSSRAHRKPFATSGVDFGAAPCSDCHSYAACTPGLDGTRAAERVPLRLWRVPSPKITSHKTRPEESTFHHRPLGCGPHPPRRLLPLGICPIEGRRRKGSP